jgi:hypothetical protein
VYAQPDSSGWNDFIVWGEGECTVERPAGQFSIFGAIEEMTAADFCAAIESGYESNIRHFVH